MADRTAIAADVAASLHVAADNDAVTRAVDAAAGYVCTVENVEIADPADPAASLPDTALVAQGLIGMARAMYLDAVASRGAQVAIGDTQVDTLFTPEDVYKHWRHYFVGVAASWGFA